jgi:16S rRNA (cytosine1402-N4)-methyltransferase
VYDASGSAPRKRRPRYAGRYPRRFDERYKELAATPDSSIHAHVRAQGRTPAGTHVPILSREVIEVLRPGAGEVAVDCTVGFGGHSIEIAQRIAPDGLLIGMDVDEPELAKARQRVETTVGGVRLQFVHSNFAGVQKSLSGAGVTAADVIFADLGASSMQIDNPRRGFSFKHDGPLDMRMNARTQRTAGDWLAAMSRRELAELFAELADEPRAEELAAAIVAERECLPLTRTVQLRKLVERVLGNDDSRPAARVFQALRIRVNDELGALRNLVRVLPECLRPNGRAAIVTFHSGEDRIVKQSFRAALEAGIYAQVSEEPIRPSAAEVRDNPRSRAAKMRWAMRGT